MEMITIAKNRSDFFYPVLAAVAMIAPILLVVAAGMLPEGLERGDFIVSGFGLILAMLATALALHAAYFLGFTRALSDIRTASRITQFNA
jgi:hypothetical protein